MYDLVARLVVLVSLLAVGKVLHKLRLDKPVTLISKFLAYTVIPPVLLLDTIRHFNNVHGDLLYLQLSFIHLSITFMLVLTYARLLDGVSTGWREFVLTTSMPNVVYIPYTLYALFDRNTMYLLPYVVAANLVLPLILASILRLERKALSLLATPILIAGSVVCVELA